MKQKIKTKNTHTHIPNKRQANYLQKKQQKLHIQESKVISVKSNNQSFISLSKYTTQAKSVNLNGPLQGSC